MTGELDPSLRPPAWVVEASWEADQAKQGLPAGVPTPVVVNGDEVWAERRIQWQQRHGAGDGKIGSLRYEHFATIPRCTAPSSLALDWVEEDGLTLVSPHLFTLLDQPSGSLQALPTETEWAGPGAPAWSYLWLAYVPTVPALDLERCEGERDWITRDGQQVEVLAWQGGGKQMRLRLQPDFTPPCGLFWAAEGESVLMASNAVADAVQRAGCTGLEFLHPEAPSPGEDGCLRRTLDGMEAHPRGVAQRDAHAKALLEPPPPEPAIILPPLGPPLHWDQSPMDWFDWDQADKDLSLESVLEAGGVAWAVSDFISGQLFNSTSAIEAILAAIRDARAGQADLWTYDLPDAVVLVRPDAMWLKYKDPGAVPEPFPLDGMDAVLARWREAIQRAPDPFAPKG